MGLVQIRLGAEEWQPPKPFHWSQASESSGVVPSKLVLVDRNQVITKHLCNLKTGWNWGRGSHVNGLCHETRYVTIIDVWLHIQPIASACIVSALFVMLALPNFWACKCQRTLCRAALCPLP